MSSAAASDYGPAVPRGSVRMQYLRSYKFIFENQNWQATILWGFACVLSAQFIPIIGHMLFAGYLCEMLEMLHRTGGARYPAFDIRRFAEYLTRSIWPLLVTLLVSIPFLVLVAVIYVGGIVATVFAVDSSASESISNLTVTLIVLATILSLLAIMFLWMFFIVPFSLRACLSQDFASSFDIRWALDFFRKTWLEVGLCILFFLVTFSLLTALGLSALCIGVFAAYAVAWMAETHLCFQLYELYLSRGGKPIPLRPLPAPPVSNFQLSSIAE